MLHDGILLLTLLLKMAIAGLLLLAAGRDVMTRTIENWVPLTLAAFCAALAMAESRLPWGLVFGAIVFIVCVICWKRGWMGGADVKLLGAVSIAVPPSDIETFILGVTLAGGVLAAAYLAGRRLLPPPASGRSAPQRLLPRVLRVEAWRIRHSGPLPYACAIAAGTLFVLS